MKSGILFGSGTKCSEHDPAVFVSGSEIARTMNDSRAQIAPDRHHEHIQREKPHQGLCNGDIVLSWWHISNLHRTAFHFSPFSCLYKMWNDVVFVRSRWCKTLKPWVRTDKAHQPICCVIKMMASFYFCFAGFTTHPTFNSSQQVLKHRFRDASEQLPVITQRIHSQEEGRGFWLFILWAVFAHHAVLDWNCGLKYYSRG